ncbi:hypothetical protein D047_0033A, partial [Vibrio parahaemolyticus VPTS-2010_2]
MIKFTLLGSFCTNNAQN